MSDIKKMEITMSLILAAGMMISVLLVLLGATLYLLQHGSDLMSYQLAQDENFSASVRLIIDSALSLTPFGLIELGLLVLVATQAIRVGMLVGFYALMRDYAFSLISLFILGVLLYSLFFRGVNF
jgi:uncharacterized membrane protein